LKEIEPVRRGFRFWRTAGQAGAVVVSWAVLGWAFYCQALPSGPLADAQVKHPSLVLLDVPPREPRELAGSGPLAFSPARDRDALLTGGQGSDLRLWDAATGRELLQLRGTPRRPPFCATFSPDGKLVAAGIGGLTEQPTGRLWDAASGELLHDLVGRGGAVEGVAFTADGKSLAAGSWDGSLRLWDVRSGKQGRQLRDPTRLSSVASVAASPDGRLVAAALDGDDWRVVLWDVGTGKVVRELTWDGEGVCPTVAFSPDGKLLATGHIGLGGFLDKHPAVILWDVSTGQRRATLRGHTNAICQVAFHPSGRWLASGSADKTARVWDCETGKAVCTLPHNGWVEYVAFSRTGRYLATTDATADFEPRVKVWEFALQPAE
jgi:WD40 repeat protein